MSNNVVYLRCLNCGFAGDSNEDFFTDGSCHNCLSKNTVTLMVISPDVKCPNCGHMFRHCP